MRYFFSSLFIVVLVGCAHKATRPTPGYYLLHFQTENGNIPVRLDITQHGDWNILNAEEVIRLDSIIFTRDSFFVKLPLFDTSLHGTWRNDSLMGVWLDHSRKDYSIPFSGGIHTPSSCENTVDEFTFEMAFSPFDTTENSKGLAVLQKHGKVVTGTILTETGDYRYLQGEWSNDKIWLSAFDGTHLFYLYGQVAGDSITNGIFLSGKHWKESWLAAKSRKNALRDPYSITQVQQSDNPSFTVLNSDGFPVLFDSTSWKNHVSIIQIMGSWCPNCTDESRFLKELYASNRDKGLQIIPVAFERGDDVTTSCKRVANQFRQLQIPYSFYYGGKASKEEAQKKLNFLTEVHSFPTAVFIDKKGVIRRVFTGYYGPGTHEEYEKHTAEIKSLVADLVKE